MTTRLIPSACEGAALGPSGLTRSIFGKMKKQEGGSHEPQR